MGEVIELREHKLREYLRSQLGAPGFKRAIASLEQANVTDSFRVSCDQDLVYVEPELLRETGEREDSAAIHGIEILLDILQRAPGEIKKLLTADKHSHKGT